MHCPAGDDASVSSFGIKLAASAVKFGKQAFALPEPLSDDVKYKCTREYGR